MTQYSDLLRGYRFYLDWDGNEGNDECMEKKWNWKVVPALTHHLAKLPAFLSEIQLYNPSATILTATKPSDKRNLYTHAAISSAFPF